MELIVLGSSSSGNCYLLKNKNECLVIEAGISFKEVKKALIFNIKKIVGILVTHAHMDHSKFLNDYLKCGIDVYSSKGTYDSLSIPNNALCHTANAQGHIKFGGFTIKSFDVQHDANEPLGFFIHHKEMGNMIFATDTYYIKYRFSKINHFLIECNYQQSILDSNCASGIINESLRNRTMKSHFELENVKKFLKQNVSNETKNIVLLHLSDRNSDEELFKKSIYERTKVATRIAEKGLNLNLDLVPF